MFFLNDYSQTQLMCCYCEGLLPADAKWCEACQEYKGVMTVAHFEEIYGD